MLIPVDEEELGKRLPNLQGVSRPQGPAEGDRLLGERHPFLKGEVSLLFPVHRIIAEVDRLGHLVGTEILIDLFNGERNNRCGDLDERHQGMVEGIIRLLLVLIVLPFPEPAPTAADIPVVQLIQKRDEIGTCLLDIIGIEGGGGVFHQPGGRADDPLIHRILQIRMVRCGRLVGVDIRIGDEE